MEIVVQKYGGSSVANPERIKHIAKRIECALKIYPKLVVVVSAMGDTTDELIHLANAVSQKPPAREMDMLMSTGEQVSIALLSMALDDIGIRSISMTGPMCGIKTSSEHRKAKIESIDALKIKAVLSVHDVVIVAGFQGLSADGHITTLGRGGSDTTAVALAAALKAIKCEIYTDVVGVFTSDPRLVPKAQKIDLIDYDEMLEMAKLGAGVLHPRSVEIGRKFGIPIVVCSSFETVSGTVVREVLQMEKVDVRGVALDKDIARISVTQVPDRPGIAFELFRALAEKSVPIDMIIQNLNHAEQNDISFTVSSDDLSDALFVTQNFCQVFAPEASVLHNQATAKLSIIGTGISGHTDIAAKLFKTLYELHINIEMISTSEIRISCLIDNTHATTACQKVHAAFGLDLEDTTCSKSKALDPHALFHHWSAES